MDKQEKIKILDCALRLQDLHFSKDQLYIIIRTYEEVTKQGGDITINDIVDLQFKVEKELKEMV